MHLRIEAMLIAQQGKAPRPRLQEPTLPSRHPPVVNQHTNPSTTVSFRTLSEEGRPPASAVPPQRKVIDQAARI